MNSQPHDYAPQMFVGVPVIQTVPHARTGDVSALNRLNGQPEQIVENHETPCRLSLIEGESWHDLQEFMRNGVESAMGELLTEDDPEGTYQRATSSRRSTRASATVHESEVPYSARDGPTRQLPRRSRVW